MEKEFGGNFCEKYPIGSCQVKDSVGQVFFDSGRSAIRCLLDYLGGKIQTVMLPEYTCASVLQPFLERNYKIVYYPVRKNLHIKRETFIQLVERETPRMILVQSYFGFDTLWEERDFLKELRKKDIIIVEDITHSVFLKDRAVCADYLVASLRKWCALPDGGILAGPIEKNINVFGENTAFVTERLLAQEEKRNCFSGKDFHESEKQSFIRLFERSEAMLEQQKNCYSMSGYTRKRMFSVDWELVRTIRRSNYSVLVHALNGVKGLDILFPQLGEHDVPLYFPVYVKKNERDLLRSEMRKNNILLPVIWPMPQVLEGFLDTEVKEIYDEIIAVPCDQRYGKEEMQLIAEKIKQQMES